MAWVLRLSSWPRLKGKGHDVAVVGKWLHDLLQNPAPNEDHVFWQHQP